MTDEEIEKALSCCRWAAKLCDECPLDPDTPCVTNLHIAALDYINHLKIENERLKENNADFSAIVKADKLCVTPKHCQNQDEIREETAKEIFNYIYKSGVINVAPDTIKMYFKEKYGVEVEG